MVTEYWIVEPENENIFVSLLNNGAYDESVIYGKNDKIKIALIQELDIDLKEVFDVTKF